MIQGVLNSGTPKWMVYNGKSYKWMIWGYPQWIENPHIPATYKPLDQPVDLFGVFHGSIVFLFLEKPEVQSCWIRQKDFKHYADLLTTVEPNHVEILIHLPFIFHQNMFRISKTSSSTIFNQKISHSICSQ